MRIESLLSARLFLVPQAVGTNMPCYAVARGPDGKQPTVAASPDVRDQPRSYIFIIP